MKTSQNPIMEQDLFSNLPSEMKIEILSRLPVRSAFRCKLVHKSWRSLIESAEFVRSYKPVSCLAVLDAIGRTSSKQYKVYEVEDEGKYSGNSCKELLNFRIPNPKPVHTSANGLLLLSDPSERPRDLVICSPATREYIKLPVPHTCTESRHDRDSYGFGVSKISCQYKIVRVFHKSNPISSSLYSQVYTLGTGSWRSIRVPSSRSLVFGDSMIGASLNGNLHWFAHDLEGRPWISCFDLETEVFTTLSPPTALETEVFSTLSPESPPIALDPDRRYNHRTVSVLRGCLGLCDSSSERQIVIWLMKEYGDERSWTKQFVIPRWIGRCGYDPLALICAVKLFEDGDVLLAQGSSYLYVLRYSNETKTYRQANLIESRDFTAVRGMVCYTPTFLPLKLTSFPMEDVIPF